ncbi:hypothetical protein ACC681_38285, partial [Rhizobium ruizarguesonis]
RNLAAGDIIFYDLKRQPYVLTDVPHHSVHFYLPRPVLDQVAYDAGALGSLVIGTDHAAEAVMGFFNKFGDGAADILPLAGLNKRRV